MPDFRKLTKQHRAVQQSKALQAEVVPAEPDEFVEYLRQREANGTWTEPDGTVRHWEPWMPPFDVVQTSYWDVCEMATDIQLGHTELLPKWKEKVAAFYRMTHRPVPADTNTEQGDTHGSANHRD